MKIKITMEGMSGKTVAYVYLYMYVFIIPHDSEF